MRCQTHEIQLAGSLEFRCSVQPAVRAGSGAVEAVRAAKPSARFTARHFLVHRATRGRRSLERLSSRIGLLASNDPTTHAPGSLCNALSTQRLLQFLISLNKSLISPRSATSKIGALSTLLIARMVSA